VWTNWTIEEGTRSLRPPWLPQACLQGMPTRIGPIERTDGRQQKLREAELKTHWLAAGEEEVACKKKMPRVF